jgi:hypothetical protein
MKNKDKVSEINLGAINNSCINCPKSSNTKIDHNHPFYYCKEHPKFLNINLEVIENHLMFANDHKKHLI